MRASLLLTFTFDTQGYSKALQDAGMERSLADHVAARQDMVFEGSLHARLLKNRQNLFRDARRIVSEEDAQRDMEKARAKIAKVRCEREEIRAALARDIEALRFNVRYDMESVYAALLLPIEQVPADTRTAFERRVLTEIVQQDQSNLIWCVGICLGISALAIFI